MGSLVSMMTRLRILLSLLVCCSMGFSQETVPDQRVALDKLLLKSGAEIRGKILNKISEDGRIYFLFRTEAGGTLKLEQGTVVRRAYPADEIEKEYYAKVIALPDTSEGHWTMYQWLSRQKGGVSRFKHERQYHLRQIVDKDPTDEKALRLLEYQNLDGRWINKELLHKYHGYVSDGGKWMPRLQLEVNERAEQKKQSKGDRNSQLKRWNKYVLGKEELGVVVRQLYTLVDENALDLVARQMKDEQRPWVRRLYVDAIGRLPSGYARNLLVGYAITDPDEGVRERAITMLQQDKYDGFQSTTTAAAYLNHPENYMVRRAAKLIGILKADNGPYYLQQVLVTSHKRATGNEPGRTQGTFSNTGELQSFGQGGGPTHKIVDIQNVEVLDALREYSGQDFGYDETRWKRWYIENHVSTEEDMRRDN
ncbi:MAG: HEAT repeat domain-containing protein [Mariniblastus sp.]|nr:HEAT repeat domain-containing protein [Mariniblastus sp.]